MSPMRAVLLGRTYRRLADVVARAVGQPRRMQTVAALAGLGAVAVVLLALSRGIDHYGENVALNIGADLVGALATTVLITPIIGRAQLGRVREHAHLNYAWFTSQVSGATRSVRLLDTFSTLLDNDVTNRFFRAVIRALDREASVQILLLDPDSPAVTLRARELDQAKEHTDVHREIMRNLRVLQRFEQRLTPDARRLLQVRLYSASAGVTLYQWDDQALVSFLSIGRLSGQGAQLEVRMGSQVGGFVDERFTELWRIGRPLSRFLQSGLTLVDPAGDRRVVSCRYADHDGLRYVVQHEVLVPPGERHREGMLAYGADDPHRPLRLRPVAADSDLHLTLAEQFVSKYGAELSPFLCLSPILDGDELTDGAAVPGP
jgi:hypothetical protein